MNRIEKYLKDSNRLKKLKLRARKVKGGFSLYIDSTTLENRERLTLNIKINKVTDPLLTYAIALRDKKELELIQDRNGFKLYNNNIKLREYFKPGSSNQQSVKNYITDFYIGAKNIGEISHSDCQAFADFLLEKLEPITAKTYFQIFKSCLNKAVREQLIRVNPASSIKIKAETKQKEFLTVSELKKLIETDCKNLEVKRAFIFSCLTGLRYSDLKKLKRSDIYDNSVILRQQKTKRVISVPLNEKALQIVQMDDLNDIFVLPGLKRCLEIISDWVKDAGIGKHITFHCARHTFAVMCLSAGINIYTLSKLMGHSSVKTTEVYAQLVDQDRVDAIKMLPSL